MSDLNFSMGELKVTRLATLFDRQLQAFPDSLKRFILSIFNQLLSIRNVYVALKMLKKTFSLIFQHRGLCYICFTTVEAIHKRRARSSIGVLKIIISLINDLFLQH